MDWSRAKTVMLVAFLGLNLILLQQVYAQRSGQGSFATAPRAADVRQVEAELAELGVSVEARIPRQLLYLPRLVVRAESVDMEQLPAQVLGDDYVQVAKFVGVNAYQSPHAETLLVLWHDGRGYYGLTRRQGFALLGPPVGWVETYVLRRRALAYLAEFPLPVKVWRFDYAVELGGGHQAVILCQEHASLPVFGSYAVVWLHEGQPAGLSWNLLEVVGFGDAERAVLPAGDALLAAAATHHLEEGDAVRSILLGYSVEVAGAFEWETIPAWRLLLADGRQVLINAYTGEVRAGMNWVSVDGSYRLTGP